MLYVFRGRLCGLICDECPEPLSDVVVRLYRPADDPHLAARAVADPKDTLAVLTDEMVKAKAARLFAEATTDGEGNFVFELGEKQDYRGGAFEIDVYCGSVPRRKPGPRPPQPRQLTITTLQPLWRETGQDLRWGWEYCLPYRFWCGVRALFDAWTICGRVVDCQTKLAIAGVKVSAFDADWITDDPLGNAVTDSNGEFRIDYTSADFHVTFLSPWINVETPFPPFESGPDVYFRVETMGGAVLLAEGRADGQKPGRANVGHCLCIELCLDKPPDTHVDTIPLFTRVGMYRIAAMAGDFTPDGLTTAGNYAFTGTLPLVGIMPDGQNSQALEYRFRVAKYAPDGVTLGPISSVDTSMIPATMIGELEYFDWDSISNTWQLTSANYYVNSPGATITIHRPGMMGGDMTVSVNQDVKPDGWIEVPRENDLVPGGVGRFIPNTGVLINLDTTQLVFEAFDLRVPAPGVAAGQSVPAGQKAGIHRYKFIFEARRVVLPNPILATNALNKITISNTQYTYNVHPAWAGGTRSAHSVASIDVAELVAAGGCGAIHNEVHALFTAYHPFAGSGSVYFQGPGALPPALALVFSPDGEAVSPVGGHLFNFATPPPCAYIIWLELTARLTSGYGLISGATIWDYLAFCKD